MNIEKNVLRVISDQSGFEVEELTGDQTRRDLNFDSLDDIELIMELEEQFDIEIPDAHAEKLKTVRDVIDYVTAEI
jgi:acyl carrier protein